MQLFQEYLQIETVSLILLLSLFSHFIELLFPSNVFRSKLLKQSFGLNTNYYINHNTKFTDHKFFVIEMVHHIVL